jgi:glycosyltransferase involved in cell wall biosynthesis
MIRNRTILCFASGYEAPPTSKHHVMHLLAENNTVLWVNYHASRAPSASASDAMYIVKKLGQVLGGMKKQRENLYTLTPMVLPLPSSRLARRINELALVRQIKQALSAIRNGPLQIWSFAPDVGYLVDHFRPEKVMYYCVDDFAHFTGYDADRVLADEADLARRCDLVVTTSRTLQESKKHLNSNTVLVPHGVDYDHFAHAWREELPQPDDLADIPRPRLGFFGLIRDWVDVALLAEVAEKKSDWHFVLIGDATFDISAYRRMPNMHFLGRKPYADLPAYCRHFDVGLIPFKVNELTRAVNPIKLREYLAAALPVISTPMPEVELYSHLIEIAQGCEDFQAACARALELSPQARSELALAMQAETWPAKLEQIEQGLDALPAGKSVKTSPDGANVRTGVRT